MEPRTFSLRYRPQTFAELYDQDHIKQTLVNAIVSDRLAHAYLFTGPRGVGKTTTARILAKSLNCEHGPTATPCNSCSACLDIKASKSLDVLEIDGASNRGIDQIRELRENIRYRPTSGRYRIYIIDEVHMLTPEAFNALLKTLEEPPAHVIFIFATTEPHKVPPTILSRCQRFDFKRIAPVMITKRLEMIIEKEKLQVADDAVRLIADIADGGLRDAESILEQITTFKEGKVEVSHVTDLLGIVPHERFLRFLELVRQADDGKLLEFLEDTFEKGYDVAEFYFGLVGFARALLFSSLGMVTEQSSFSPEVLAEAQYHTPKGLARMLGKLLKAEETFKRSREKVVFVETLALSLIDGDLTRATPADPEKVKPPPPPDKPAKDKAASNVDEDEDGDISKAKKPPGRAVSRQAPAERITDEESHRVAEIKENPEPDQSTSNLDLWKLFLQELSTEHSFVSIALQGSTLIDESTDILSIEIKADNAPQLGLLEHERETLEARFWHLSGKKIRLSFSPEEAKGEKDEKAKTSVKDSRVEDVLDIFKGEIVR